MQRPADPVPNRRSGRLLTVAAALVLSGTAAAEAGLGSDVSTSRERDGRDVRAVAAPRATVAAAFAAESYPRGSTAELVLFDSAASVQVRLYRVGDAVGTLHTRDVMRGTPMSPTRHLGWVKNGQTITFHLDARWPSGLYFAELKAPRGRIGYAPFVLAPRRLGGHRIAVVLPTQTWQAYNLRDDDGDGRADSWYAAPEQIMEVPLIRPFGDRGVPPYYRSYDEPFLRWLARNRYEVDYLSDAELRRARGRTLARAYELMIFGGHHEYVTERAYDAVTEFRDRGGNLMFLSANNFFRKVTLARGLMTRVGQWRQMGRPEAALVGVRYFSSHSRGRTGAPWVVRDSPAARWIFRGTGLAPGSPFAHGGIEADSTSPASPRGIQVVAEIPDVFGDGRAAQMTVYEAPSGARVFAAGAFTLAGSVWQPPVRRMMANLIEELSVPLPGPRRYAGRS